MILGDFLIIDVVCGVVVLWGGSGDCGMCL